MGEVLGQDSFQQLPQLLLGLRALIASITHLEPAWSKGH